MEGDQAVQSGCRRHIVSCKVKIWRDLSSPRPWTRPVLAQQCSLLGPLARVAVREADPMAGCEEYGRWFCAPYRALEAGFGGNLANGSIYDPIWVLLFNLG